MLKWFWLLFLFGIMNALWLILSFWQLKHANTLNLFGVQFKSLGTFLLGFCFLLSPVFMVGNFIYFYAYWYGYNEVFPNAVWRVQETLWLSSLLVMFFSSWLYLGELPTRQSMIALLFLVGALITILWK